MPDLFAALYQPDSRGGPERPALRTIADAFSPRYELHSDALVSIDVSGLQRLLGTAESIGAELHRDAASRGMRVHVGVAGTRTAAVVIALATPGVNVVAQGEEAKALASIPIGILEKIPDDGTQRTQSSQRNIDQKNFAVLAVLAFKRWGLTTLGELAALPDADLVARLGAPARLWQTIARGEEVRPLVPTLAEERFDSTIEL